MSIHPVLAALAGLVILQQVLDLHEWAGILIVVIANVFAVAAAQAQSRTTGSATGSSFPAAASPASSTITNPRPLRVLTTLRPSMSSRQSGVDHEEATAGPSP
jgi:drug/metabolite transporter (DMT)-like permease